MDFKSQINMEAEPSENNHVIRKTEIDNAKHNDLTDIQGGKPSEYNHLDNDEYEWFTNHFTDRPLKPSNIVPENEEPNVYQYPEFSSTEYKHPRMINMQGVEIQIYSDSFMQNLVTEEFIATQLTQFRVQSFENIISISTTYYWRVRYVDDNDIKSAWSELTSFTTGAVFEPSVILRPFVLYPAEGHRVSPLDPVIMSSPFQVVGATDAHKSSDWQISNSNSFDPSNILAQSLDDTVNLTSMPFSNLDMTGDLGFYTRVRYEGTLTGKSSYSPIRHALLREFHDDYLIGVGITNNGWVRWIDEAGNLVNLRHDYFEKHPLYQFPRVIVAGQYMRNVIETHCRADFNTGGFRYRYWISPIPFNGSSIHGAFGMSQAGSFLIGEYLNGDPNASSEPALSQDLRSQPGLQVVNCGKGKPNANWLNTGEDSEHAGWGLISIWEYCLIALMVVIEKKTFRWDNFWKLNDIYSNMITDTTAGMQWRGLNNFFHSGSNRGLAIDGWRANGPGETNVGVCYPDNLTVLKNIAVQAAGSQGTTVHGFKTEEDSELGQLQFLFIGYNSSGDALNLPLATYNSSNNSWSIITDSYSTRNIFPIFRCPESFNAGVGFSRLVKRQN